MESVLQVATARPSFSAASCRTKCGATRDQVPFVGNVPNLGDFFAFRNETASKSELVIFLRTVIVPNPSLESDELRFFQRFLPQPETPPDLSQVPPILRPPDRQQPPMNPDTAAPAR